MLKFTSQPSATRAKSFPSRNRLVRVLNGGRGPKCSSLASSAWTLPLLRDTRHSREGLKYRGPDLAFGLVSSCQVETSGLYGGGAVTEGRVRHVRGLPRATPGRADRS